MEDPRIISALFIFLKMAYYNVLINTQELRDFVSAKYCYATHELRLHQNDRCKRFTLF